VTPDGKVAGVYRKTHPFCTEMRSRGGWVTPGDEVCVVETELGRIGLIICFDGDYPELSRITALRGAEIICRPSALLRSADIWSSPTARGRTTTTSTSSARTARAWIPQASCTSATP
jgi:predicted amidohydrolase